MTPRRRLSCALTILTVGLVAAPVHAQVTFENIKTFIDGADGRYPAGPMAEMDGWIYGLTQGFGVQVGESGFSNNCGSVFRFNPADPSGTFETISYLYDLVALLGDPVLHCQVSDGGLVKAADGFLYFSIAEGGGTCNRGRVMRITPAGVASFADFGAGQNCFAPPPTVTFLGAGLSVGPDGAIYGAAGFGGTNNTGGVYRVGLDGVISTVASFPASFPAHQRVPNPPIFGTDGRIYGSVASFQNFGGSGPAVVYRADPASGLVDILETFDESAPLDGVRPHGRLLQVPPLPGHDVGLLGTTRRRGALGGGTLYRLDISAETTTFTKLFDFLDGPPGALGAPAAGLIETPGGKRYGTTWGGGHLDSTGPGVGAPGVFEFTAAGAVVPVVTGEAIWPYGPLLVASDGKLYGTSSPPGNSGLLGSIFRLTPANQNPLADAGPDQTLEATGPLTAVALNGTASSDPDPGDVLTFEWRDAANAVVATTALANLTLPLGAHTFTLTVDDGEGGSDSDTVVVTVVDTTPPTVTVVGPNGGEKLFSGTPYLIEWTASDAVGLSVFNVFYSIDAGVTFDPVPGCSGVNGALRTCTWNAPGPASTKGRVRVVATDGASHTASDSSNANFTLVTGSASIAVTAPNTAVDFGIGSSQHIKWSHTLGANAFVRIELSRNGRESWETIAGSVKNTGASSGTFTWVVTGPPVTAQARVRVSWVNGPTVSDTSNVDFNISHPFVLLDTAGLVRALGYGTPREQKWTTNLGPADKVTVRLSEDGGATFPHTLAGNVTATTKSVDYTVPSLAGGTTSGRVRVEWTTNGTVHGSTPVDLAIQPAFIEVTSPNIATDTWSAGSSATVSWASNLGGTERVRLELSLDGGATYPVVLAASTPADGSHNVNVQAGWVTPGARVRVAWVRNGSVTGVSAQSFVIQ